MRVLAICRGAPGLGRVVPSLGLIQTLGNATPVTARFASYGAAVGYLSAIGQEPVDLTQPSGRFIAPATPQADRVRTLIEQDVPDLVLVDGEFMLPALLSGLGAPLVYLANPHDLIGEDNAFRQVNRSLLAHADAVLISSLACSQPTERPGLIAGTPCLEVPPIIKEFPVAHHRALGPPRVLVTTGGGSIGADPVFRTGTDAALAAVLHALADQVNAQRVAAVTVVLGSDATLPAAWRPAPPWLTVRDSPTELTAMYAEHELLIARAGRNTAAEAIYCGIPTMLLPITADPHRGSEQAANADAAGTTPVVFPLRDWEDGSVLRRTLAQALRCTSKAPRGRGLRGNGSASAFLTRLAGRVPCARLPAFPRCTDRPETRA